jgi:putative NIF3 family GTP cyclohydrolase 1 type 2
MTRGDSKCSCDGNPFAPQGEHWHFSGCRTLSLVQKSWRRASFESSAVHGETSTSKTIQEVVEFIMSQVTSAPLSDTVDTLKAGDPAWPVTGIVTTFMATFEVLRRTAAIGANLIITHEPTYYNHLDRVDWLQNDAVYQAKRRYLAEHQLAVWRFHDHWHRYRPDGILTGVVQQLEWESYQESQNGGGYGYVFNLPPMPLASMVALLQAKLGVVAPRVVGSAEMMCRRVAVLPGSPPGEWIVEVLRKVDVLIGGEAPEWQTYEYVRDAMAIGQRKALIMLGHERSEEPGIAYLAKWLEERFTGISILHIPSREPTS